MALFVLFTISFIRTAWITEDAFITFRVIDNVLQGLGLVWNQGERVQVYTHPLWMGLLIPFIKLSGEPYYTTLWLSFALMLLTLGLLVASLPKTAPEKWAGVICILALLWSKSFMDYSSSGLENPLTHALLATYLVIWCRSHCANRTFWLTLVSCLLYLTRPDAILLTGLSNVVQITRSRQWKMAFLGLLPLLGWTLFSLFYYGAIVPNTALAKVGNGLDFGHNARQAWHYISWCIDHDSVGMALLASGILAGLIAARTKTVAAGLILWLGYLFYVGGDYMGGRFFSGPIVLAAGLITNLGCKPIAYLIGLFLLLGASSLQVTLFSPINFHQPTISTQGIADERGFYYPYLGWMPGRQRGTWESHPWMRTGRLIKKEIGSGVFLQCVIGMTAYAAGPRTYWIDPLALTNPFLARLPARSQSRVGHYERAFPTGYLDSVLSGHNQLEGKALGALYADVFLATRAALLTEGRIAAIWRLNTGTYRHMPNFDKDAIGLPGVPVTSRDQLSCMGIPRGGEAAWQIIGPPAHILHMIHW